MVVNVDRQYRSQPVRGGMTVYGRAAAAFASVLVALAAAVPVAAQEEDELPFPEGWQVRFDRDGASTDDLYLVTMLPGMHVTTGPAMIAWHPDSVAVGNFRIESETFLFDPEGRREAFGFFVGGSDLHGSAQRYSYFLIREGGEFLVKTRSGDDTDVVHDWAAHPAIVSFATKPEDAGTARNVLALEAAGDELRFSVNGEQVWSGAREGLATDGVFGLRVNHGLNLHVTTIAAHPAGTIELDSIVVTGSNGELRPTRWPWPRCIPVATEEARRRNCPAPPRLPGSGRRPPGGRR